MSRNLMECGHTAQGTTTEGSPVCVICAPDPKAYNLAKVKPQLKGRIARCAHFGHKTRDNKVCTSQAKSSTELPFFKHQPDSPYDEFYCGCWGWD